MCIENLANIWNVLTNWWDKKSVSLSGLGLFKAIWTRVSLCWLLAFQLSQKKSCFISASSNSSADKDAWNIIIWLPSKEILLLLLYKP